MSTAASTDPSTAAVPPQQSPAAGAAPIDDALAQQYAIEERRFETAALDVHLPFLEVKLYRKYFIQNKTPQRLDSLRTVVQTLQQHRVHTLRILKAIHEREGIMRQIRQQSDDFAAKRISTLDVQTQVLQLLYAHQQASLKVIEAVQAWRTLLTRPYPFHWNGVNYLRHILHDCEYLDASGLRTILPLRVSQFPLCSNITSLSLFAPGANGVPSGSAPTAPATSSGGGKQRQLTEKQQQESVQSRLRDAEAVVFEEAELQAKLMRELAAISSAGYFVPLLNLQPVIPSCTTGIRISNRHWTKQLADAIKDVVEADDVKYTNEDSKAGGGGGGASGGRGALDSDSDSDISGTPSRHSVSPEATPTAKTSKTAAQVAAASASPNRSDSGKGSGNDSP